MSSKKVAVASVLVPLVALAALSMGQVMPLGFGDPLAGVTPAEQERFLAGKVAFETSEEADEGLGPVFNENSCLACHLVGGTGGGSDRLETRFGRVKNGQFDPLANLGGSLLQDHGIGQAVTRYNFVAEQVPPQANVVAKRRTTPLFGLGLVDNVPDALLQQIAQFEQNNSPDTAGRISSVLDQASGQQRVGRFGWKCQQATLFTFSGDAYLNEMGITTTMFPDENCPQGNCALLAKPGLPPVPNDDNQDLEAFTDFMSFLGPPPRGPITQQVQAGGLVFVAIGCANCHTPALQTGPNASAALNRVTFFPFSDFLLHDMGSLGDGIVQGGTWAREMRTAPLWGVRLMTTLLHDGRAANLTDAILAHDGQGRCARNRFTNLSSSQKDQLLAFLNSL